MRMRGLEPPPGFPDTDLNRTGPENMGSPACRVPSLWGFVSLSNACDDAFVATLLPRAGHRGPRWRGDCELPADAACGRGLDLSMGCAPSRRGGSPRPRGRRLAGEFAAVLAEVSSKVALLHAAISMGSTSPSSRRDLLAALAPILKHKLNRLAHHHAGLVEGPRPGCAPRVAPGRGRRPSHLQRPRRPR